VGFALVSWQALAAMLLPAVAWVAPRLKAWSAVVPCFGRVHGHGAMAALIAVTVAGVWVPCRNADWAWLLQDILGLSLCVLFLRQIVLPNLKVSATWFPSWHHSLPSPWPPFPLQFTSAEVSAHAFYNDTGKYIPLPNTHTHTHMHNKNIIREMS
jgi:hypothetical protein